MPPPDGPASRDDEPLAWLPPLLMAALVLVVVVWVVRRTSWYLAVDQFGYLTFASDLTAGRVVHDWPLVGTLKSFLPKHLDADVLAQTYVLHDGSLFCRYAPGFPLVLAGASLLFGELAPHYVNASAVGLLLVCVYWVARRVFRSAWLGLSTALLVTLLPNHLLLWSISPLRDVPAHAVALAGLGTLVPASGARRSPWRFAVAGLLLGFAVSIRVDAVLYALPAVGLLAFWRPLGARDLAAGAIAVAIGAAPLLAYNAVATGNPLRPTQAMELDHVLSSRDHGEEDTEGGVWSALAAVSLPSEAYAQPGGARKTRAERLLQGGGLRLRHLRETLPSNLALFVDIFGALGLGLGALGAILALRLPALAVLTVPYCVIATLFFSLWARPDARYLAGAILLLTFLVVRGASGLMELPAMLRRFGRGAPALLAAVGLAGVIWLAGTPDPSAAGALPFVILVLAGAIAIGLAAAVLPGADRRRHLFPVILGLALASLTGWRTVQGIGQLASFQRPAVEQARATLSAALGDRAVVITTTEVGRPAENINHYTDASALYLDEVVRWGVSPGFLLDRLLQDGFEVYLLLPPSAARLWLESEYVYPFFQPQLVADIPPDRARDYFVASARHQGVRLWLVQMHRRPRPLTAEEIRKFQQGG
ncbi:MAG: hypothetical protein FJ144_00755 [Deltaproteobacteria bacterium]|nr:hypothetical protein [Deltaproteobacteria bacterium]